jgi:hypothetical protein
MRKVLLATLAAGFLAVAIPSPAQLTHHNIKAEDFIEYITVANPYTEWQTWPGTGKFYKGRVPLGHGVLITTYANHTALRSIAEKRGMANGSIIVVENYNADKTLAGLTTMYKVEGYNPEAGDWYWVEAAPSGKVMRSGKTPSCINCHRAQAGNDYLWTGEVVKGRYNKTAPETGEGPLGSLHCDREARAVIPSSSAWLQLVK